MCYNEVVKQKLLIEKFLELTEIERQTKVVSYPMLGHQSIFTADISKYGFDDCLEVYLHDSASKHTFKFGDMAPEVKVPEDLRLRAAAPLERMLELSR